MFVFAGLRSGETVARDDLDARGHRDDDREVALNALVAPSSTGR
jgi:hypothetical protein